MSRYRFKKEQKIKHQGWVDGNKEKEERATPSESSYHSELSYGSRPVRVRLPSGKMAWISHAPDGSTRFL